ncbi:MAG: lysoplasmalogenase [Syntrophales bacterium]
MLDVTILTLAFVLLIGLLYAAKKESVAGTLMTKPLLSLLFIAVVLIVPQANPKYFCFILAGLIFCMLGDVFLIFVNSKKLFMAGLASFLVGHIFYGIAFFTTASPGVLTLVVAVIIITVSSIIFLKLRPYLGKMTIPVFAYVVIITIMVIGAATLMGDKQLDFTGRSVAFCGAVLFYCSDMFVARQRFIRKDFINRLIGLPLYYVGQFMIAYSVGLL